MKVGKLGSFENVVVKDVPVGPATSDDARAWAIAMLVGRVELAGDYVPLDGLTSEWAGIAGVAPLAGRAGDAPNPEGLEEVGGKPIAPRTQWLLAAPADLSLET